MLEVNSTNFKSLYPAIQEEIMECDFIAFDLEYSGIELQNQSKYCLFDSIETRYDKLRQCLSVTSPFQFGLALFKRHCDNEGTQVSFTSKVYNFLLLPPNFDILDGQFVCSSSALKFLRMNNIDLNRIVDHGISFVSNEQLNFVYGFLKDSRNQLFDELKDVSKTLLNACHDKIFAWLSNENGPDTLRMEYIPHVHPYQFQIELRKKFNDIWTNDSGNGYIIVSKVDEPTRYRKVLDENNFHKNSDKYAFYQEIVGFTRLVKTIINFKKPMVGHNIFLDLVAIYEKFYHRLPLKFGEFREDIHRLFPTIYDTKFLFYQLRRHFPCITDCSSGLEDIFKELMKLNNEREVGRVSINMLNGASCTELQAHHAGYDAYMAGASLLLLSQLVYMKDRNIGEFSAPDKKLDVGSGPVFIPSFRVYKDLLSGYCNTVNLIRARDDCVSFDIKKQKRILPLSRPPYLLIYKHSNLPVDGDGDDPDNKFGDQDLSLQNVADLLSEHGQGDSRLFKTEGNRNIFIVAMSSFSGARSVLKAYHNHPTICARKYSPMRDNPLVQNSILCAAVLSTVVSSVAVGSLFIPAN